MNLPAIDFSQLTWKMKKKNKINKGNSIGLSNSVQIHDNCYLKAQNNLEL